MNKRLAFVIAVVIAAVTWSGMAALWLLRYGAMAVLLFIRPVVSLVFGFAAGACIIGLVLGAIITAGHPEHRPMLWGFFAAGVASTVILFCYDAIVLALAPSRFPMLLTR